MKRFMMALLVCFIFPLISQAYEVGIAHFQWDNGNRPVSVAVWYPGKPYELFGPYEYQGYVKGQAYEKAAWDLSGEPYPLIIFSHGLGMCAYQSVFLAEYLASQGYIVMAVDHADASLCHIDGGSDKEYKDIFKALIYSMGNFDEAVARLFPEQLPYLEDPGYRPTEISFALTQLLAKDWVSEHLDASKIGIIGHSFGGWTAFALAGAQIDCTDPADYSPQVCQAEPQPLTTAVFQQRVCCNPVYQGQITDFRDERIKALIAIAPGTFIFPNYNEFEVSIPTMIISGDHFEVDWYMNASWPYQMIDADKYLLTFRQTSHMTPSDLMYNKFGAPLLRGYWFYCLKKKWYTRFSSSFFNAYLREDEIPLYNLVNKNCLFWQIQYQYN